MPDKNKKNNVKTKKKGNNDRIDSNLDAGSGSSDKNK